MEEDHEKLIQANSSYQVDQPLLGDSKKPPKSGVFVYILTFFAATGGFLFGYDTGVISGALIILTKHFHLSFLMEEFVVSITIAFAIVGAVIAGPASQFMGRRISLIIAAFVFTVGAVLMAIAHNVAILLVGRAVVGLGIGGASMTVPVYIAEASPAHLRGKLVTLNTLFITAGQFIASVVDGLFSSDKKDGWRYMLGLSGVPAVIMLLGLSCMPETPRWLVSKGKIEKARKTLKKIRNSDDIDDEIKEITQTIAKEGETPSESNGSIVMRVWNTPSVRRALFVGCGLQAIQQVCGINTVMYYSSTIIKMAGTKSDEEAIWLAVPVAFTNFIFTLVGVFVVEKAGRRKLLLSSLAGVIISLLLLSVTFFLELESSPDVSLRPKDIHSSCIRGYDHCYSCVADSHCGFCYTTSHGKIINGSCLPVTSSYQRDVAFNNSCNTNKGHLTWVYDHCPFALSWMAVLGLVLYLAWFAPGMGPMPWTINSEIYPQWARSFGNACSATTNWIFNLFVSMSFLHLTKYLTKCGAFALYSGIAFTGWLFIYCYVPETKGKSLEEVNLLFSPRRKEEASPRF